MQVEKKKILERTPGGTFSLNEFTWIDGPSDNKK
jgi:hypothetical protein